jgi:hypothetical protein
VGLGADLIEAHGVQERLLLRVCEPVRQAASGQTSATLPDIP